MLTPKQALFVKEYLVDFNATQAVIRAGYTPTHADRTGPRLLGNVEVRAAIEECKAKRNEKAELTGEWVLMRMQEEANFKGEGSSHSARVAALKHLANQTNVCRDKMEHVGENGGPIALNIVRKIIVERPAEIEQGTPAPSGTK